MILLVIAILIISFTCYGWGLLIQKLISNGVQVDQALQHIVTLLYGLIVTTIIAAWLSLFIAIGNYWVTIAFVVIAMTGFIGYQRPKANVFSIKLFVGFGGFCLLILLMGVATINHPDTLGYHAQIIKWINEYKAVPGIVNLHERYGYQGLWFVAEALYSYGFFGSTSYNLLNVTLAIWSGYFFYTRIAQSLRNNKKSESITYLMIMAISLISYPPLRLSASSASIDGPVVFFIFISFYLFLEKRMDLLIVLAALAITAKLSALPLIVLAIAGGYQLATSRQYRQLIITAVLVFGLAAPFFIRNVIASGYLVFPYSKIDVVDADWKYPLDKTVQAQQYIKAYARARVDYTDSIIEETASASFTKWIPSWWKLQSVADKLILILTAFALVFAGYYAIARRAQKKYWLAVTGCVAGIIFWFFAAPDPRFGFGFFLVAIYLAGANSSLKLPGKIINVLMMAFTVGVLAYCGYRFKNFFLAGNIMYPSALQQSPATLTVECNGIKIQIPINSSAGNNALPCADNACESFEPRGMNVEKGFRAK